MIGVIPARETLHTDDPACWKVNLRFQCDTELMRPQPGDNL